MKNQALLSSKDKLSKKLKCRLLQFLYGALRVNILSSLNTSKNSVIDMYFTLRLHSIGKMYFTVVLGNYKDALGSSNGLKFTTKDVDNDNMGSGNCALQYSGGWWSDDCGMSLNRRLLQHDRYCANFCDRCIKTSSMKIIRTTALTYL